MTSRPHTDMALGRQMTIEYYDCSAAVLADGKLMERLFVAAAKASGATVLDSRFHDFTPQGVSGVVIISESHFAVHAWPEHDYAAVDIFTCGDSIDFSVAAEEIKKGLHAGEMVVSSVMNRGIVGNNGIERLVPVYEDCQHRFSLSWRRRFEDTGAWGLLVSIDLYGVSREFIGDEFKLRKFCADFTGGVGHANGSKCEVLELDGRNGEFSLLVRHRGAFLSGRVVGASGSVYLDLFDADFFEPREAAELATKLLRAHHYRMQVAVRQ